MATRPLMLLPPLIFSAILLLAGTVITQSEGYFTTTPFEGFKPENLTHLHFYFHDVISGDKPTAIQVAESPISNTTDSRFGVVMVADNPMTEGPDTSSKEVGRAQGMYVSSDMKTMTFTMVFNLVFTEGEFNGSTVSMYGRNPILSSTVREMPIIGGTGAFRFGRGYAQAKTYKIDGVNAIVEYNVFICH